MICKKFIYVFIIFITISLCANAVEKASIQFDEKVIDYSKINVKQELKEADMYFNKYETTSDKQFLTTASGKYYICTKINPLDTYSITQLARTYDIQKYDRLAKSYFYDACGINKNDPYVNYYFGEFYYKRQNYKKALRYCNVAYNNGYKDFYELNIRLATIYEKIADLEKAKYHYKKAYTLNPKKEYLKDKILQIESLNYDKSQYYKKK